MKKLIAILATLILIGITVPAFANAIGPKGGLVPCGRVEDDPNTDEMDETTPCRLCHLFLMFENIVNFVLRWVIPPIAVVMIVIGGVMFLFAGASEEQLTRAKSILTTVVIGLVLIYGAWIITNAFLTTVGVADWTGLDPTEGGGWFQLELENCPTSPSEAEIDCHDDGTGSAGEICQEECGASPECDNFHPEWPFVPDGDLCEWCNSSCQLKQDTNRECAASNCKVGGWDNEPCNGNSSSNQFNSSNVVEDQDEVNTASINQSFNESGSYDPFD